MRWLFLNCQWQEEWFENGRAEQWHLLTKGFEQPAQFCSICDTQAPLRGHTHPFTPSKACCQQTCFSELLFTQFLEASLGICKTEVCSLCFSSRCSQALLFPYGWEVPGTGCCWPKSLHPPAPLAFWEPSYTTSTALVIPQNGLVCLATDRGTAVRQKCHKLIQAASFHDIRVAV